MNATKHVRKPNAGTRGKTWKKRVQLPWFPLYVENFIGSETVTTMTAAQVGVFVLMLCLQWRNGDLPHDIDELVLMLRHWRAERADVEVVVRKAFVEDPDLPGRTYNRRLRYEENAQRMKLKYNRDRQATLRACRSDTTATSQKSRPKEKEKEKEREKEKETTKNTPAREALEVSFHNAWMAYPKRGGGNSRAAAFAAFSARLRSGIPAGDLLAGAERYARYCASAQLLGSKFVKTAAAFFGPDEHWREPWDAPQPSVAAGWKFPDLGPSPVTDAQTIAFREMAGQP